MYDFAERCNVNCNKKGVQHTALRHTKGKRIGFFLSPTLICCCRLFKYDINFLYSGTSMQNEFLCIPKNGEDCSIVSKSVEIFPSYTRCISTKNFICKQPSHLAQVTPVWVPASIYLHQVAERSMNHSLGESRLSI